MARRVETQPTAAEKDTWWRRYRAGATRVTIAQALGEHVSTFYSIVSGQGGIATRRRERADDRLSPMERERISSGLSVGRSIREMARALQRTPSTASREIVPNGGPARYRALDAEVNTWRRAKRPKQALLVRRHQLRTAVHSQLCASRQSQSLSENNLPRKLGHTLLRLALGATAKVFANLAQTFCDTLARLKVLSFLETTAAEQQPSPVKMQSKNSGVMRGLWDYLFGKKAFRRRLRSRRLWLLRKKLDLLARFSTGSGISRRLPDEPELVVSLTTIPHRVATLHRVVESILRQTSKPHRVVLWIGRGYFPDESWLTPPLRKQLKRGLSLMYDEREWPHKKLIPSLRTFPSSIIVTIDDDVMYSKHMIETLLGTYERSNKRQVVATLARRITAVSAGAFSTYSDWGLEAPPSTLIGMDLLALGVGGVLYPPGALHEDVLDEVSALKLSPKQDDLWFKVMGLRNQTGCVRAPVAGGFGEVVDDDSQDVALWHHNSLGGNDETWKRLCEAYQINPLQFT